MHVLPDDKAITKDTDKPIETSPKPVSLFVKDPPTPVDASEMPKAPVASGVDNLTPAKISSPTNVKSPNATTPDKNATTNASQTMPTEKQAVTVTAQPVENTTTTVSPAPATPSTQSPMTTITTVDNKNKTADNETKPDEATDAKPAASNATSEAPAKRADDGKENAVVKPSGFDGSSFVGGIILTMCLLAIGFIGFKYYRARTERNYHTL